MRLFLGTGFLRSFKSVHQVCIAILFLSFGIPASAQLTSAQTGVQIEALQRNFNDMVSFSEAHGRICKQTLIQVSPGGRGVPKDLEVESNMAGIMTTRWKQEIFQPDGTKPATWDFECVTQIRAGRQVVVIALVMYERRGFEIRGVELLTGRDVRIVSDPR